MHVELSLLTPDNALLGIHFTDVEWDCEHCGATHQGKCLMIGFIFFCIDIYFGKHEEY